MNSSTNNSKSLDNIDKECIELSKEADEKQLQLLKQWLSNDLSRLENNLLEIRMYMNKLVSQLSCDELNKAMIRCGALIGTAETIERLLYERNRDTEMSHLANNTFISTYLLDVKYDILDFIYNTGVVSNKDIQKKLGYNDYILSLCIDDQETSFTPLVYIKHVSTNIRTYSLTDYGLRYMKYTKEKRAIINKLVKEVYGGVDDNFEEITDKQIESYLSNIGKVEKPITVLKKPLKGVAKSVQIYSKAAHKVISNRLNKKQE